uniref:Uncharacterized protein n=2 Tax=Oryza punctata TaxID=4537 RepID=A0A0E0KGT0_ORYPU
MSYASSGGGERAAKRSAFHIDYGGGMSLRRLAQPEALARGMITQGSAQLRTGAAMAVVFQEDLKNTSCKIFDPQDRLLVRLNRSFVVSCIVSIAVDPVFFYVPQVTANGCNLCVGISRDLAISTSVVRTVVDLFFAARIVLQFRTAYIAPSSRVFVRGELVIDTAQIAARYFRRFFAADLLSILPLPQIVIWKFLHRSKGAAVLSTKDALLFIVFLQYIPRVVRIYPLSSELKRTSGAFAGSAYAGAAYYLSDRGGVKKACNKFLGCNKIYMYCGNDHQKGFLEWRTITRQYINETCEPRDGVMPFNYGIYTPVIRSDVIKSNDFTSKLLYCLWWGLANLRDAGEAARLGAVDAPPSPPPGASPPTASGGRSGFFNRSLLEESDFCGEELLTWALDPKAGVSLPSSTRTVRALSEVEAFALHVEELKFVAGQFRRMHSKQVQHTFSSGGRGRRPTSRPRGGATSSGRRRREDEEEEAAATRSSAGLKTTMPVSRFAANAIRGVHRQRSRRADEVLMMPMPKPSEPDFGADY